MNEVVSWARVLSVLARGISPWARSYAVCAAPASKAPAAAVEAAVETARGGSAAAVLAATAAAAVLADICGSHIALCEAKDGGMDPRSVKAALLDLWRSLDEQMHRIEATLPHTSHLQHIPEPEVQISAGGEVDVTFKLPQELDIPAALRTLRSLLRSPSFSSTEQASFGSSVSESSSSGAEGRATQFVRRSTGLGGLAVDVLEPHDRTQPARLHFRGKASRQDLELMTSTLQSAMQPRRGSAAEEFRNLGRLFEGTPFGRPFEAAVDPFFEHLKEFIHGFERMAQGEGWQLSGVDGEEEEEEGEDERDTEPTPLHRRYPKQFDDWGSGPGSSEGRRRRVQGGEPPPPLSQDELEAQRKQRQFDAVVRKLEKQGAQVFMHDKREAVDWGTLAGYEAQKRQIEDTLLLALLHPEVYNDIAKKTRRHFASNRPRAVLFEGPPGTGKTTSARIIASQAAVPLVYIPLEAVVSKWYGESEKQLSDMLQACEKFPEGCIIFLDELDSLATSRSTEMHEATRRVLGVLLRHLDGFDSTNKRTVVIGATNRKQDLDPALISRFSTSVNFGLPDEKCRVEILKVYAQHLGDVELLALAAATPGMAGRDLRNICAQAERRWASKIIRGKAPKGQLPPVAEYLEAARQRLREMAGLPGDAV